MERGIEDGHHGGGGHELSAGIDALLFNRWQVNLSESTVAPTFVVKTLADIKQIL